MGQTLTHGVYLPDEGERNCYSGLAANWSILDGAVGTVAEHTSALSGKAPLVHTHSKSDITDFPAYGNAAGTICEGNDARLSDARTPVAHTHTKSDVTNLFNSANTWTGDNTFTKFVKNAPTGLDISENPSSKIDTGFRIVDKDGNIISNLQYTKEPSGNSQIVLNLRTKDSNNVLVYRSVCLTTDQYSTWCAFRPNANNTISLGTPSYQWSSVYAQSYYYNGVAWGLDQGNTWTGANSFYKSIQIHGSRNAYIMPEFSASYSGLTFGTMEFKQSFKFGDWVDNNSTIGLNTSNAYVEIYAGLDSSDGVNKARLNPVNTTVAELGTSTNKWKTLNGINPGALSLPNTRSGVQIDITNWDNRASPNGLIGNFTAPVDCIVSIQMTRDVDWGVWVICGNFRQSFRSADNNGTHLIFLTFPVAKGEGIGIYCPPISSDETPITFIANKQLYFPCLGNV